MMTDSTTVHYAFISQRYKKIKNIHKKIQVWLFLDVKEIILYSST